MKKVLMLLFVGIISLGFVTGCGKKTKEMITADEFKERIGSNYKLVDYTKNIGYVKKAYFYESEGIYFYFYEGNRSFDMGNIYIDEVNSVAINMMNKEDEIDKGDNYSSVKIWNDESYYRIAYVDNTLLYVKAISSYKDRVDDIFNKCGY